ncbi:hypothetical protein [Radiobacillus deserti]|uniref:DUF3139 domain-containing protein n=1 Tax=Radiobacillus deserti TaxID=2594883 RepID=A0A516KJI6_9BACI|nr:hypothetical protein [Radiobacillus deserti]QDP41563.1 hypothetical protein FN924_16110 [Radiobacillus deserti]
MKKKLLWLGVCLLFFLILSIFGPYNMWKEFNEDTALKQLISEDNTFQGLEVMETDYFGSDTYLIQTKEDDGEIRNFIVMNYHSSVMNGHWKVFEQTSNGYYY